MPESLDKGKRVKFTFTFEYDPGYRTYSANGIWGGLTPRGDMLLDFFVESIAVPERVTNELTPDGRLGTETERHPEGRIVRRVQCGVLMSIEQADTLADFIKERVAEFRKLRGG